MGEEDGDTDVEGEPLVDPDPEGVKEVEGQEDTVWEGLTVTVTEGDSEEEGVEEPLGDPDPEGVTLVEGEEEWAAEWEAKRERVAEWESREDCVGVLVESGEEEELAVMLGCVG